MIYNLSIVDKNVLKIVGKPLSEGENGWEEDTSYTTTNTINVIKYQPSNQEDPELLDFLIVSHNKDYCESLYPLKKDGHYIIDHIVIPKEDHAVTYYTDGLNIYKKGSDEIVDIVELLEVNDETIIKDKQETFSICYLHECYLELCNNKFKQLMRNRCNKKEDVEDFNLDLIGLSLSAIRYNLEFGYMNTAQTIVEDLNRCVSVCNINFNKHECGCCC